MGVIPETYVCRIVSYNTPGGRSYSSNVYSFTTRKGAAKECVLKSNPVCRPVVFVPVVGYRVGTAVVFSSSFSRHLIGVWGKGWYLEGDIRRYFWSGHVFVVFALLGLERPRHAMLEYVSCDHADCDTPTIPVSYSSFCSENPSSFSENLSSCSENTSFLVRIFLHVLKIFIF